MINRQVSEKDLGNFRRERLSSTSTLDDLERSVHLLYRLGVGVGKSHAADQLLTDPATYGRFDLVIYAAPSWNIINERSIVAGLEAAPVNWLVLRPRPVEACGQYAEQWTKIEESGCSAYGKGTLCRECQTNVPRSNRCFWPKQLANLKGAQLIFTTEQQIVLNRSLVWLLRLRTEARRVLVVLDEARFLDGSFEVAIEPDDLERFRDVVQQRREIPRSLSNMWVSGIDNLLKASSSELAGLRLDFPGNLNRYAFPIQSEGIGRFGSRFRYLGYQLAAIQWGPPGERWKGLDGVIHFTARPYLNCHLLLLSAHLSSTYAAHRLGRSAMASPFEHVRFRHTGTRIVNLKNRIGADSYFRRNHRQILDVFAVLVLRNILLKRSTLLISRKKSKCFCAEYLKRRLQGWGFAVRFVTDAYDSLPNAPRSTVVPIIHYGILGVNDFTEYESAYCLNSYYVSTTELNRHVQDTEPRAVSRPTEHRLWPGDDPKGNRRRFQFSRH